MSDSQQPPVPPVPPVPPAGSGPDPDQGPGTGQDHDHDRAQDAAESAPRSDAAASDSPYGAAADQSPPPSAPVYGGEPDRFPPPEGAPTYPQAGYGQGYPQQGHPPQQGYAQQGYPQPGYAPPGYVQTSSGESGDGTRPSGPKRGLAIAALIVGGVSVLLALIPFISYLAIVTALVGIVLGIIALLQKDGSKGLALGGLITAAVALILAIALSIFYTAQFIDTMEELSTGGLPTDGPLDPTDDPFDEGMDDGTDDGADDQGSGLGSRDEPDAIGSTASFSDIDEQPAWEVTPGAPTLDANAILAADDFNEPPPAGTQYAILPLTITYVGDATGQPYEIEVQFVSADGTSYDTDDVYAVIPEDLYDVNELYPDGSATGNVVIPIPTDAIDDGTWAIRTAYSDPYFYSVE